MHEWRYTLIHIHASRQKRKEFLKNHRMTPINRATLRAWGTQKKEGGEFSKC